MADVHNQTMSPTAAGRGLDEGHVHGVDVGALLAVHLDGHEALVQELRDALRLEGLPLHDVAPVAGGVAGGEKDGPVQLLGALKRLLPPR